MSTTHTQEKKEVGTARVRFLHIAPRKVRSVADTIRGLSVLEAEAQLTANPRRASVALLKLLRSAVHNMGQSEHRGKERLFISHISVDDGPVLKRVEYRARGTVNVLRKGMSHVSIELTAQDGVRIPRYRVIEPEKKEKKPKAGKETEKKGTVEPSKEEQAAERQVRPSHEMPGQRKRSSREAPERQGGGLKRIFRRKSV